MHKVKALQYLNHELIPCIYDLLNAEGCSIDFYNHRKHSLKVTDLRNEWLQVEWQDEQGPNRKIIKFEPRLHNPGDSLIRVVQISYPEGVGAYPRQYTRYQHWDHFFEFVIDFAVICLILYVICGFKLQRLWPNEYTQGFDQWLPSVVLGLESAHGVELVTRMIPRLRLYRVPLYESCLWSLATFLGGVIVIRRFDRSVAPLELEQDAIDNLFTLYD